jgi:putative acetyltransferase
VLVLGAPSFYGRFGFVPAGEHGIGGPYDAAGNAFQVRARPGSEPAPGTAVFPPMFEGL